MLERSSRLLRRAALPVTVLSAMLLFPPGANASGYLRPGVTVRVDVSSSGAQAKPTVPTMGHQIIGSTTPPSISGDGRVVAFVSNSPNLVSGDTNESADIFVHAANGPTQMVSTGTNGLPSMGACATIPPKLGSDEPAISANGRFVAFSSCATNLVTGDTNLSMDVFVRDLVKNTTTRVNVSSTGEQAKVGSQSGGPAISADGRYVAFWSTATNLVQGSNSTEDVFVHDMWTKKTVLATLSSTGAHANASSDQPSISATGRYVVFRSSASNLAPGGVPIDAYVYVRDMKRRKTQRVSVASDGSPASDNSLVGARGGSTISANGRFVVFTTQAGNLVPNDTNFSENGNGSSGLDAFVYDRKTGRTSRVSVSSSGAEGNGSTFVDAYISANGRYVSFPDYSDNWFTGDTPGLAGVKTPDQFVYDRQLGELHWISVAPNGSVGKPDSRNGTDQGNYGGAVSSDGRSVAFLSNWANLVPHDTNAIPDDFVRDWGPDLGVGGLAGTGQLSVAGDPAFSATGVVHGSDPTGAGLSAAWTKAGADLIGASLAYRHQLGDLFGRLELQDMPMFAAANPALVYGLDLRVRGVRYEIRANAVAGVARFGLFRLNDLGLWTKVADLEGGYGTTGDEVVFALPLSLIGAQHGGRLGHVEAFTALGSFDTGPVRVLDQAELSR